MAAALVAAVPFPQSRVTTMATTKSIPAQAAAEIRKALKSAGISARCTSARYSGGDSVDVYVNDLQPLEVKAIEAFAGQFQYGHFDGMTDCYEYSNKHRGIPQSKYVFVRNEVSDKMRNEVYQFIRGHFGGGEDLPETREGDFLFNGDWISILIHRQFCQHDSAFWQNREIRPAPVLPVYDRRADR